MNIRRFKQLRATGMSYAEIGRECGCDWRTVRKYLSEDAPVSPPSAPSRKGTQKVAITAVIAASVDAMLRACIDLKATVICERLADEHDVHVHYQRVKNYCRTRRPQIRAELGLDEPGAASLHRRIATLPGAQAQVDWGDEGDLLGTGVRVYSFHMTLSYSRDPFCCFVTSMDAATFFDCHRRAFDHLGGVPAAIVYDRLKTVVRRHVAPGKAVPVTAAATAFAGHYGYVTNIAPAVMDGHAVVAAYHDLWKVEQSFRMAKSDLKARPVFHRTRDSIEAHLTVVFAALAVARHLQHQTGATIKKIVQTLQPLRTVVVTVGDRELTAEPTIDDTARDLIYAINAGH